MKQKKKPWTSGTIALIAITCGLIGFGIGVIATTPQTHTLYPKMPLPGNTVMIGNTIISCGQVNGEGNDAARYINCTIGYGVNFNMSIELYQ